MPLIMTFLSIIFQLPAKGLQEVQGFKLTKVVILGPKCFES